MERVLELSIDLPKHLAASGTLLVRLEEYTFAPLLKAVLLELPMIARVVARAVMCFIIVTNSMMESGDRIICVGKNDEYKGEDNMRRTTDQPNNSGVASW